MEASRRLGQRSQVNQANAPRVIREVEQMREIFRPVALTTISGTLQGASGDGRIDDIGDIGGATRFVVSAQVETTVAQPAGLTIDLWSDVASTVVTDTNVFDKHGAPFELTLPMATGETMTVRLAAAFSDDTSAYGGGVSDSFQIRAGEHFVLRKSLEIKFWS